jgi:recombination protein RecA
MAKAAQAVEKDVNEQMEIDLSEANLSGVVRPIDEMADVDVTCYSTGLPKFDRILHREKLGLPAGRDVEIHSDDPEVGKTALALRTGATWQRQGKRVAICDIAGTITTPFLHLNGFIADRKHNPQLPMPLWVETESSDGGPKSAEEILNILAGLVNTVDLIIVDDVPCMIQAADLEKEADENSQTGAIAKHITQHMRKTTHKRATVIWINQRRERIAKGGKPGIPPKRKSMAGEAIPFWSSIRVTLSMVEKMSIGPEANKENVGMKIQAYTMKNKVSPPFKSAILTYLDDEGFTGTWDYFELALKAKIIDKSGSWYAFDGERIGQGEYNTYKFIREHADVFASIKKKVDELTV